MTTAEPERLFATFYRDELGPQVRRAALIVGSAEQAKDIVQDAMVEVYRRWQTLESPGGYLNRAVLNGCRDACRRRSTAVRLLHCVAERAPRLDATDLLDDVLDTLPFRQRAAIVLRFYAGLTTAEIAEALGCAPGSVGPYIDRGLKKMKGALQ